MNKETQKFEEPQKPKLGISVVMPRFLLRPFYLLLKKDMVRRLSEKHGEQFIDDVMKTFEIPTNLMDKYFKNRDMQVNINEVIECGNKLYYDINPNSKMDVPSMFYVRLEKEWVKWKEFGSELSFYDFCKSQLNVA